MELDTRTLFVVAVPAAFLFFAVQLAVWSARRNDPALAFWALANLVGGIGAVLIALRGTVPEIVSIALANALLVASLSLVWTGMRRFAGRELSLSLPLGFPLLAFVLLGLAPLVSENYVLRTGVTSVLLGIGNLAIALDLARDQRREHLRARTFLVWVFGLQGLFYFYRALQSPELIRDSDILAPDAFQSLTLLLSNLKLLAWNLGALLMANERMHNRLHHAATCDALTNVLNRAGFREMGARQLQRSRDDRRPVCVLLMDLDRFKSVNDRYGHDAGDRVLCAFAQCARGAIRPTDLLARFGGEEFCALLPDADEAAALQIGERVRQEFAAIVTPAAGAEIRCTASIGVARIQIPDETIHAALIRADAALYRAKASGRNRICLADVTEAPLAA
jgi:diguanylate cyclase (GGDEF)-like protein